MHHEDGKCPFCGESLDPSSPRCPSCRRNIFQSEVDDFSNSKIQPLPPSISLTPRNLLIGGIILLLIAIVPTIAFLRFTRSEPWKSFPHQLPSQSLPQSSSRVVCQADWSKGLNGWAGSSQWKVLNGKLLSDGMNIGPGFSVAPSGSDSIMSPSCQPSTKNYAVEAKMQILDSPDSCYLAIRGRVQPAGSGYGGYFVGFDSYFGDATIIPFFPSTSPRYGFWPTKSRIYNPGLTEHLYHVEFRENQITLKIDNHVILQATDNRFLGTGEVGLENGGCQISVSSFKILTL